MRVYVMDDLLPQDCLHVLDIRRHRRDIEERELEAERRFNEVYAYHDIPPPAPRNMTGRWVRRASPP